MCIYEAVQGSHWQGVCADGLRKCCGYRMLLRLATGNAFKNITPPLQPDQADLWITDGKWNTTDLGSECIERAECITAGIRCKEMCEVSRPVPLPEDLADVLMHGQATAIRTAATRRFSASRML